MHELFMADIFWHNVHSLINFADDVKRFGPLDRYSAFPFENKLGILKRMLRKYDLPMQQIVKRIHESQCQNSETLFYKCHRWYLGQSMKQVH